MPFLFTHTLALPTGHTPMVPISGADVVPLSCKHLHGVKFFSQGGLPRGVRGVAPQQGGVRKRARGVLHELMSMVYW